MEKKSQTKINTNSVTQSIFFDSKLIDAFAGCQRTNFMFIKQITDLLGTFHSLSINIPGKPDWLPRSNYDSLGDDFRNFNARNKKIMSVANPAPNQDATTK